MRTRGSHRGFTLIELIIVILIMAGAVTMVALGWGATTRASLRSSCFILAAATRFAYSRAVTQGTTVRVVMDFQANTIRLEETSGRVVLNREDETGTGLRREGDEQYYAADGGLVEVSLGSKMDSIGADIGAIGESLGSSGSADLQNADPLGSMMAGLGSGTSDPFLAAMQAGGQAGNPAGYRGPRFEAIEGSRGEPRKLEGSSVFRRIYSPHEPRVRDEGLAYIYFFPGGVSEHTLVQISDGDEDDERIYTVEVHPLSGRAFVHNEEVEPKEELDELQEAEE